MAQSTITNFFANRKRPAPDELRSKSKIAATDVDGVATGYGMIKRTNVNQSAAPVKLEPTVVSLSDEAPKLSSQEIAPSKSNITGKTTRRIVKSRDPKQVDMKTFLRKTSEARQSSSTGGEVSGPALKVSSGRSAVSKSDVESSSYGLEHQDAPACQPAESQSDEVQVPADPKENLEKRENVETISTSQLISSIENVSDSSKQETSPTKLISQDRKRSAVEKSRRELSLGDIRSKLTRSARLAELKASMARFDEGRQKLKQIEEAKQNLPSSSVNPQLSPFKSIELEVPVTPSKSPMKSPLTSPQKGLAGSRSPAFQRYSSLVSAGTPALTLPYSYRHLAELFRCVEQVVKMYHFNRKEVITFKKLQPAVQRMSGKNFSIAHLAQIMTVYPEAYILKQEKVHDLASPSEQQYQLIIAPSPDIEKQSMTSSVLVERQRHFYKSLLAIVKQHHQEFLASLNPPITVPLESLTRWHPEFAVDQVPDIPLASLPKSPNLEKCNSAKDVLAKARELYSCNARMEKALESVALSSTNSEVSCVNVEIKDPSLSSSNPPTSPFKSMQLSSALKGIPKALLEKVRARQAAKAMEAMTRTSAQDKEVLQYSRLPELARILRNIFVAEKKGALQLDLVLDKLGNSYRTALSSRELEEHIRLLAKAVPGWVSFEHLLKTDYLRLSKKADMGRVMKRLNELALNK